MDQVTGFAVEHRSNRVTESDDDLASFLSGLRSKYNQLFPENDLQRLESPVTGGDQPASSPRKQLVFTADDDSSEADTQAPDVRQHAGTQPMSAWGAACPPACLPPGTSMPGAAPNSHAATENPPAPAEDNGMDAFEARLRAVRAGLAHLRSSFGGANPAGVAPPAAHIRTSTATSDASTQAPHVGSIFGTAAPQHAASRLDASPQLAPDVSDDSFGSFQAADGTPSPAGAFPSSATAPATAADTANLLAEIEGHFNASYAVAQPAAAEHSPGAAGGFSPPTASPFSPNVPAPQFTRSQATEDGTAAGQGSMHAEGLVYGIVHAAVAMTGDADAAMQLAASLQLDPGQLSAHPANTQPSAAGHSTEHRPYMGHGRTSEDGSMQSSLTLPPADASYSYSLYQETVGEVDSEGEEQQDQPQQAPPHPTADHMMASQQGSAPMAAAQHMDSTPPELGGVPAVAVGQEQEEGPAAGWSAEAEAEDLVPDMAQNTLPSTSQGPRRETWETESPVTSHGGVPPSTTGSGSGSPAGDHSFDFDQVHTTPEVRERATSVGGAPFGSGVCTSPSSDDVVAGSAPVAEPSMSSASLAGCAHGVDAHSSCSSPTSASEGGERQGHDSQLSSPCSSLLGLAAQHSFDTSQHSPSSPSPGLGYTMGVAPHTSVSPVAAVSHQAEVPLGAWAAGTAIGYGPVDGMPPPDSPFTSEHWTSHTNALALEGSMATLGRTTQEEEGDDGVVLCSPPPAIPIAAAAISAAAAALRQQQAAGEQPLSPSFSEADTIEDWGQDGVMDWRWNQQQQDGEDSGHVVDMGATVAVAPEPGPTSPFHTTTTVAPASGAAEEGGSPLHASPIHSSPGAQRRRRWEVPSPPGPVPVSAAGAATADGSDSPVQHAGAQQVVQPAAEHIAPTAALAIITAAAAAGRMPTTLSPHESQPQDQGQGPSPSAGGWGLEGVGLAPGQQPGRVEWGRLSRALLDAGFTGLVAEPGAECPDAVVLYRALAGVLSQYNRRQKLVSDLLAATRDAAAHEEALEAALEEARREAAAACRAAERARREAEEMATQQLPRTRAELQGQLAKARGEIARMKEVAREAEAAVAGRDAEVKALQVTVASLQLSADQAAESAAAGARARVALLEAALKAKEKEVERLTSVHVNTTLMGAEGTASALERAFAAEDAAQGAAAEAATFKARCVQLEQALKTRERELGCALAEADARLATAAAAAATSAERADSAEAAVRRAEADAAQARARCASLEATLRSKDKEIARLKEDSEAVRGAAYDELYRAEDEIRGLKEELAARSSKVTQLDHVVRAKEREMARVRDARDAARAAERERAKVAEDGAVQLETELASVKQRAAQLESSLRVSQREVRALEEALRAARGVEGDGVIKSSKAEEGTRKLEGEVAAAKMRALQAEAALRARERELEKAVRLSDGLRADLHEAGAKVARAEEGARKAEGDAAAARSRALHAEGTVRVKERELERLGRLLEAAKLSEVEWGARVARAEESCRKAEGDAAAARARTAQLENTLKARDAAIEKLNRALDSARREEWDTANHANKSEEAARKLDGDLSSLRARITQLEGQVKSKDKEVEKAGRAVEGAKAAEYEAIAQKLQLEEGVRQAEEAGAAARARAAQAEAATKASRCEVERLEKLVGMVRASEWEMSVKQAQAEEAARAAGEEVAAAARRASSLEGLLRAKCKEVDKLRRQVEAARGSQLEAGAARSRAEDAARAAAEEIAALKQALAQAEGAARAREREVEKVARSLQAAQGSTYNVEAAKLATEEAVRKLEEQSAGHRARITQLEGQVKAKDKEVERLGKQVEALHAAEVESSLRVGEAEEGARKLESELASLRSKLAAAESSGKARERQLERLEKMLAAAKAEVMEAEARRAAADEAARGAEADAAAAKQRAAQAESAVRARERDIERLRAAVDGVKGGEVEVSMRVARAEEAVRQVGEELDAARTHSTQVEAALRERVREVERLNKAVAAARGSEHEAEALRAQAEDAVRKLEAEVAAGKARAHGLESALRARDRDVDALQRLLEQARGAEAVAAAGRARVEGGAKRVEAEVAGLRARALSAEAQLKAKSKALERAQAALDACSQEADGAAGRTEAFMRGLEEQMDGLRRHAAQLDGVRRARDSEIARLTRELEAARAQSRVVQSGALRTDEEARRFADEVGGLRARVAQLEGAHRAKAREVEALAASLDAARAAEAEMLARSAAVEEAARKLDAQASGFRARLVQMAGTLKARESQVARLERSLEAARVSEQAAYDARTSAEEAVRRAGEETAAIRSRLVQAESALRAREREVAALSRQLDSTRKEEHAVSAQAAATEEAARKLDGDLNAMRSRLASVQASLKARDAEVARLARQLDASRGGESEVAARAAATEDAFGKLDADLSALRGQLLDLQGALRAQERETDKLSKALAQSHAAELALEVRVGEAEEGARVAREEAAAARSRTAQVDAAARAKEREADKAARAADAARAGQRAAELRAVEAEEGVRAVCEEAAALRARVAQAEAALKSREREVERLAQVAQGSGHASEVARVAAEDAARKAEEAAAAARARMAQAEAAARAKEKEVAALTKQLEAARAGEVSLASDKAVLQEAVSQLSSELANMRARTAQLEGQVKGKEKEVAGLVKQAEAARAEVHTTTSKQLQKEDAVRVLETDLAAARTRITQLEGQLKTRDKEVSGLQKLVESVRAAEHAAEVERLQAEDATRSLDGDLASLRSRITQLEGQLKAKDKEVEKANRQADAAKSAEADAGLARAKAEELASRAEADAASLRAKITQLEGAARLKEKEIARQEAALEAARLTVSELQEQVVRAEEAVRKAGEEAATARGRAAIADSSIKVKEREIERLSRLIEAARASEYEMTAAMLQAQEAMQELESRANVQKARITQLEGQVKAKDKEVERLGKQVEGVRKEEYDAASKALANEEAARKLDGDVMGLRQRVMAVEAALRARDREVERLSGQATTAAAAHATELKTARDAVARLESELAQARSKAVANETASRAKEADVTRLGKLLEATKASEAEFAARSAEAGESVRRAESEAAAAKTRAIHLESALRAKEVELSKLSKAADAAHGGAADAAADKARAEEAARKLDGDLSSLRARITQLEGQVKSREKDVEKAGRAVEGVKTEAAAAVAAAAEAAAAAHKAECELGATKSKLAHAEASVRVKEREVERLSRLLGQAETQGSVAAVSSDETLRRLEEGLAAAQARAAQAEGSLKAKEREVTALTRQLDTLKAASEELQAKLSKGEEVRQELEAELSAAKGRATAAEGATKSRDREVERLARQIAALQDEAAASGHAAKRDKGAAGDEAHKLEAALATARARITALESEAVARERELRDAQRMGAGAAAAVADTAAAARVAAAEEGARKADHEVGLARARVVHLEHALRSREGEMDKLRGVLADKVSKEERRVARDKEVYGRLRSAFAQHRQEAGGKSAAGAVAAAARELRPVEIVGVYEAQRETLEGELAAAKAEVRALSGALRDAQNMIALKDRTGGWRNPLADAEVQAKMVALERRAAELAREAAAAREAGADAVRVAERRVAEAERRAAGLAEENAGLLTELQARPTLQEKHALRREVDILERRVAELRGQGGGSGSSSGQGPAGCGGRGGGGASQLGGSAGVSAEGGEAVLGAGRVGRAGLVPRDQMRRDREVHRLGLRAVEDLGRDVLVAIVQDVAIELEVGDATSLPTAARKLVRVVSAVPRMEAFIAEVCEAVYSAGEPLLPPALRGGPKDPTKVVGVIHGWLGGLRDAAMMRSTLAAVAEALGCRSEPSARASGPPTNPQDLVAGVRQVVAAEAAALAGRAALGAAEAALAAAPPQDVLAAPLRHFQQLFEVTRLEGLVPAMNKVYMTLTELRNFVRGVASALGLPAEGATTAAAMAALHARLAAPASSQGPEGLQPDYLHKPASSSQQQQPEPVQLTAEAAHALEAVSRLGQLLNAQGPAQVCEAAGRLVGRLRKLDEVLPRYQATASALYELLAVRGLEEVVPAVRTLLARAS